MDFDYFFGDIRDEDADVLVALHKRYWGDVYGFRDTRDLFEKAELYTGGIAYMNIDGVPRVVCEVPLIRTYGEEKNIPRTAAELLDRLDPGGDTRVLSTFSVEEEFRHIQIGEERIIYVALKRFAMHFGDKYEITFSPDTPKAQHLHGRYDAYPIIFLPNARPGLYIEGVRAEDVRPRAHRWTRGNSRIFDVQESYANHAANGVQIGL